jgi:hypothetical protein
VTSRARTVWTDGTVRFTTAHVEELAKSARNGDQQAAYTLRLVAPAAYVKHVPAALRARVDAAVEEAKAHRRAASRAMWRHAIQHAEEEHARRRLDQADR